MNNKKIWVAGLFVFFLISTAIMSSAQITFINPGIEITPLNQQTVFLRAVDDANTQINCASGMGDGSCQAVPYVKFDLDLPEKARIQKAELVMNLEEYWASDYNLLAYICKGEWTDGELEKTEEEAKSLYNNLTSLKCKSTKISTHIQEEGLYKWDVTKSLKKMKVKNKNITFRLNVTEMDISSGEDITNSAENNKHQLVAGCVDCGKQNFLIRLTSFQPSEKGTNYPMLRITYR